MMRAIATAATLFPFLFTARPALATGEADLIEAIALHAGISTAAAGSALNAFAQSTAKPLKKGDRIGLVGFGSFSVSKRSAADGPGTPPTGLTSKPLKVAYRDGTKTAGTLTIDPTGWTLTLGIPSRAFADDDPLAIEVGLPKPFEPKLLEMEVGLPSTAPGTMLRAMLDGLGPDEGLVLDIRLPTGAFDDVAYDELNPGPDYFASFFPSFFAGASSDPSAAALLSERIGFGGVALCADGAGCPLSPPDRDALLVAMSTVSGLDLTTTGAALDAILALPAAAPLPGADSASGVGAFAVAKRAARTGRNPQTGKEIKIKAKKVAKFKAGSDLAGSIRH